MTIKIELDKVIFDDGTVIRVADLAEGECASYLCTRDADKICMPAHGFFDEETPDRPRCICECDGRKVGCRRPEGTHDADPRTRALDWLRKTGPGKQVDDVPDEVLEGLRRWSARQP